ncbi:MAG: LssY C-terminal domain-containing protein, partial [Gemmataceae bacterium]
QQDVAFESAVTRGARARHHVRFWCAGKSPEGRNLWVGADTFDAKIGISKATGKPTHHIDPDIDRERDFLIQSLRQRAFLERDFALPHLPWRVGRNGENDCYFTDGNVAIGVLKECGR